MYPGTSLPPCPICGVANCGCGDDHMIAAPLDWDWGAQHMSDELITTSGRPADDTAPIELRDYEYMVGHVPITAQLTAEQAKILGATEVGQHPGGEDGSNNEAERLATHNRAADDAGGVDHDERLGKAREARNKRSV